MMHYSAMTRMALIASICMAVTVPLIAEPTTSVSPPPVGSPSTNVALQSPDEPWPKINRDGTMDKSFALLHAQFLERTKQGPIGLLFLGDSITQWWNRAPDLFQKQYGSFNPANFGIAGDHTQHVLWRIANGELDGISPKVVVLMIGTNNFGQNAADLIARADTVIVQKIHEKLPDTKVLLLGVFPRGNFLADRGVQQLRDKVKAINLILAKLDDGSKTRYLDIGPAFLEPDGTMSKDVMSDGLHPTVKGYEIWARAMQPLLDEMMK